MSFFCCKIGVAESQAQGLTGVLFVGIVGEEGFRVSENGGESKLRIVEGFLFQDLFPFMLLFS